MSDEGYFECSHCGTHNSSPYKGQCPSCVDVIFNNTTATETLRSSRLSMGGAKVHKLAFVAMCCSPLPVSVLEQLEGLVKAAPEYTVFQSSEKNLNVLIVEYGVREGYKQNEALRPQDITLDVEWEHYGYPLTPFWECEEPKNPWGVCIYEHSTDPMHDTCLFCGQPEERK